jgi:hypothetical protein
MALEVNGKLVKVMTQVTGEGAKGPWVKQEFVIETFRLDLIFKFSSFLFGIL